MREAWDHSTAGYAFLSSEGLVTYGNEYSSELFGNVATEKELGARFSEVPAQGRAASLLTIVPGVTVAGEVESIPVTGGRWLLFRLSPDALDQNRLFSAILDSAGALLVVLDRDFRFVRFNRAAETLTGYGRDEVLGAAVWDVFCTAETEKQVELLYRSMDPNSSRFQRECEWRAKNGSIKTISWMQTVLRDEHGDLQFVVSTGVDVTGSRKAEQALRSLSEQALKEIQEERSTTSRFLHDTVSQDLVALSFSLSRLQQNQQTAAGLQAISQSMELLDRCCRDVRLLSYLLAPPLFEEIGLIPALEWYGGHLQREAGMSVELDFELLSTLPSQERQALIFAALQACVARSVRQMDKTAKTVGLRVLDGMLSLRYDSIAAVRRREPEDVESISAEFQLIRERLRHIGGRLDLEAANGGIVVTVAVPMQGR